MKKQLFTVLIVMVSIMLNFAQNVTINFKDLNNGSQITNQFKNKGIVFDYNLPVKATKFNVSVSAGILNGHSVYRLVPHIMAMPISAGEFAAPKCMAYFTGTSHKMVKVYLGLVKEKGQQPLTVELIAYSANGPVKSSSVTLIPGTDFNTPISVLSTNADIVSFEIIPNDPSHGYGAKIGIDSISFDLNSGGQPDFTLSATPIGINIMRAASNSYEIVLTRFNGSNGDISLSIGKNFIHPIHDYSHISGVHNTNVAVKLEKQPFYITEIVPSTNIKKNPLWIEGIQIKKGVRATFSENPLSTALDTTTLILTVNSTAKPLDTTQTFTLVATPSSLSAGPAIRSVKLNYRIENAFDLGLIGSSYRTIVQKQSTVIKFNVVQSLDFHGQVSLRVDNAPAGIHWAIDPASIDFTNGSGDLVNATLTLNADADANIGLYPIQIVAFNKSINMSKTVMLSVDPDMDQDGISDVEEARLLAKFRPYYRFTGDEEYRPTDVMFYLNYSSVCTGDGTLPGGLSTCCSGFEDSHVILSNEDLLTNQESILTMNYSNFDFSNYLITNPVGKKTNYHINPKNNPGRNGNPWSDWDAMPNIGLYGHVAKCPKVLLNGFATNHTYYKIDYWQFFGYNDAAAIHEGDWDVVRVIIDHDQEDAIISVIHSAHGVPMRYDMGQTVNSYKLDPDPVIKGGYVMKYEGPNHDKSYCCIGNVGGSDPTGTPNVQNNVLRLYRLDSETLYTHPVVYVEEGDHEYYPTDGWWYAGVIKSHSGDNVEHSCLTETPPNLGEIGYPLSETLEANIILHFNGHWGTYRLPYNNEPPQGPTLHGEWGGE